RIAHDHEGRVLLLPALADVGTAGFLANGMEPLGANDAAGLGEAGRPRRLDPDPGRLAQYRRFRPMRLFGMARPRRLQRVEDDGHGTSLKIPLYLRAESPSRKLASPAHYRMNRRLSRQFRYQRGSLASSMLLIRKPKIGTPSSCRAFGSRPFRRFAW